MGQRSQTFIRVLNPLHYYKKDLVEIKKLSKRTKLYKEYKKWETALGTEKYTILAYHHQWLYGLTFPSMILKVLKVYKPPETDWLSHPLNLDTFMSSTCQWSDTIFQKIQRFVDFHTFLLGIVTDPWQFTRDDVMEGFRFLNFEDSWVLEDFDWGDNNDGVCIIDGVTGKYAFVAFGGVEGKVELPNYTSLSAVEYVRAYYPKGIDKLKEGYEKLTDKAIKENAQRTALVQKKFKGFKILTWDEIQAIFPKMDFSNKKYPDL